MTVVRHFSNYIGEANNYRDYYEFTITAPTSIQILGDDASFTLLNAVGNQISELVSGNQTGDIIDLGPGTYFLEASNGGYDAKYSYQLTATPIVDLAGNSFAKARNIGAVGTAVQSYTDWLGGVDTADFYKFSLSNPETLNLLLTSSVGYGNLYLYNSSGTEITGGSNPNNEVGASLVDNLSAGVYYVEVANPNFTEYPDENNYKLQIWTGVPTVGTPNSDGAGNTLATARNLGFLSSATFDDWVGNVDSDDYYKLVLANPSFLSLQIGGLTNNLEAQILNAAGESISGALQSYPNSSSIGSIITDLPAGTYYVDISANNSGSGYHLSLSAAAIPDHAGATLATARSVTLGAAPSLFDDWIGYADADDIYKFTVTQQTELKFALSGATDTISMALEDIAGATIINRYGADATTSTPIDYIVGAGTYYLDVSYNIFYIGGTNYTLSASAIPHPDQGGDDLASARAIGALTTAVQSFSDTVGLADPDDYYKFTIANTATVNLLVSAPPGIAQPYEDLALLDVNGNTIAYGYGNGSSDFSIVQNLQAGTYYAKVEPEFANGFISYDLKLWTGLPAVGTNGTDGAGNSLSAARNIGVLGASTKTFADWIGAVDKDDFYKFTLNTASSLNVLLSGVLANTNFTLEDIGGHSIASEGASSTGFGSLVYDLSAGVYYVDVSYDAGDTGYNLALTATPITDPAGSSTATALNIGNLSVLPPKDFSGVGRSAILFYGAAGQLSSWQLSDTAISGGGAIGTLGAGLAYVGSGDFSGDGRSDLLLRKTDGTLVVWSMNGATVTGTATLGNPGPAWSLVGIGDFDGDGQSDLLFRESNGTLSSWRIADDAIVGVGALGNPGANWIVKGVGEFNEDGKSDILLENSTTGVYAIWNIDGDQLQAGATLGSPGAGWVFRALGDFNGDGTADLLFQNTTSGAYATWDIVDDSISGGGTLGSPGAAWTLRDVGDYNGDGKADLLFQNASGALSTWDLDDTAVIGGGPIGNPGPAWAIAGAVNPTVPLPPTLLFQKIDGTVAAWGMNGLTTSSKTTLGSSGTAYTAVAKGDFNGDGKVDALFKDSAGDLAIWETDGAHVVGGGALGNPGAAWAYVGVGDFNGDGRTDILLSDAATGVYAIWDLNGTSVIGGGSVGAPGGSWKEAAIGDFNGDGRSDILFQDSAGDLSVWDLDNTTIIGGGAIGNPGSAWKLLGAGDFNGDGRTDLLFQKTDGTLATWDLSGATLVGGGVIGNPGAALTFAGIADLNGDGKSDILFHATGGTSVSAWILNDTSITQSGVIGDPGAGWRLVG